jgi:hypothetical protein
MAIHAAAALQTASTAAEVAVGQHAQAFMQAATQALSDAVVAEECTFVVAECGAAGATADSAAWPKCVPRGARMFPSEAPRPPAEVDATSTSATAIRAVGAYASYARDNAPRSGAEACYACPYCISSSSRGAFQVNAHCLRRHVREKHTSNYDASDMGDYLHRSPLFWCTKVKNSWEPVFGDDVMRVSSSYIRHK